MRKKIIYGAAAFLATLVGGSIAIKKKKKQEKSFDPSQYQGVWSFIDDNQQNEQLRVSPTFDFSINDHSLGTTLIELNEQQLIVRDHYGYYLTLSYEKMTFYDESTDSTYQIKKIGRKKLISI